jgi:hypothetical protein
VLENPDKASCILSHLLYYTVITIYFDVRSLSRRLYLIGFKTNSGVKKDSSSYCWLHLWAHEPKIYRPGCGGITACQPGDVGYSFSNIYFIISNEADRYSRASNSCHR